MTKTIYLHASEKGLAATRPMSHEYAADEARVFLMWDESDRHWGNILKFLLDYHPNRPSDIITPTGHYEPFREGWQPTFPPACLIHKDHELLCLAPYEAYPVFLRRLPDNARSDELGSAIRWVIISHQDTYKAGLRLRKL
ncbi:MAG: hypothetical protein ACAI35_04995 [Candidatus Methylacidiphilales bacterium]|nr:hypothetical protein [Candidatus Methylacidiphilales bacterium]